MSSIFSSFCSLPFMCSFVDSYQGQDEEIDFFFPLTDNIFFVQSMSHPCSEPGTFCTCNLIQRNALVLYKAIMGNISRIPQQYYVSTFQYTFWVNRSIYSKIYLYIILLRDSV